MRERILEYLEAKMGVDISDLDDDTPLVSSGIIDSFSLVDLITFIESTAAIRMDTWDVSLDNLDTIARIMRFVSSKAPV